MKTKPELSLPFARSFRHTSLRNDRHLHRISAKSVSVFRTSVRYSKTQQEYDLQQKIDLEIKMREGTAKLLAACKHMNQSLEAAKSLLTSDTRLIEFRKELQVRKSNHKNKTRKAAVHSGNASVSEIRIPLIWKETEYFKNKGDYRRFAVFCLIQMGSEIYDTVLMNVDRNVTDICFEDSFNFHRIEPEFQFKLYVYARLLQDDLSIAPTHKKFTQKISSSVSRSLGRRFSHMKDDFDSNTGPKFHLMATASLNLKDASDAVKTHDLAIEDVDKGLQLPLFGDFCCRFAVQPDCQLKEYISGLVLFSEVVAKSDFVLCWCSLKNFKLNLWPVKEELRNEPVFVKHTVSNAPATTLVPINSNSKLVHQGELITIGNSDATFAIKCCYGSPLDWYKALLATKEAFMAWEPIAEYNMDLASLSQPRSNYCLRSRLPGSLYEETPIQSIQELRKRHSKSLSNVSSLETKYNSFSKNSNLRTSKLLD